MYYVLHNGLAYGPFLTRDSAFLYAGGTKGWSVNEYAVKSDAVMQRDYIHWTIHKPN